MARIIKCSDIMWYTNELTTNNNGQPEAFCCMVNYTVLRSISAKFGNLCFLSNFTSAFPASKINWRKTAYFDLLGFGYELFKTLSVVMPIEPVLDRANRAQDAFQKLSCSEMALAHNRKTNAVFTRDTFTRWGKLTFLLYCVTISIVK